MFTIPDISPRERAEETASKLRHIYPESEIQTYLPLIEEINQLKKAKNTLILGHNYMRPEVLHGISDVVGDSYALAKAASKANQDIILFNGVYFMTESAKILNPQKKVLIADPSAGCSLADGITPEDVRRLKQEHPGAPVVTYINSSAAVKAESDVVCTSSNALKIVSALSEEKIIFIPDRFLAANIAMITSKTIIPFQADCEVHRQFTAENVDQARSRFPGLAVLAHPECSTEVTVKADFTGSTSAMIEWIENHPEEKRMLLLTECSMGINILAQTGDREFLGPCQLCPYMQKITLEKIRDTLFFERNEVFVDEEIRVKALRSLNRMLELA